MTQPTDPTDPTTRQSDLAQPATPATPSPEDDRVAVLAAYLRSNRSRFTQDALARAARDAGYTDAEIKAASTLAEPGWHADGIPASEGRRSNYWVVAAAAIAYVIVLYLAISAASSVSSDLSGSFTAVGLLGGVIAWALLRNVRPSLAQGIGCGVVLAVAIPIVLILVLLGICIATGSYPVGP